MSNKPDCKVLRASEPFIGKQGFSYAPAISAETVGSSAIHMQLLTMPPGARAKAHLRTRLQDREAVAATQSRREGS